jgi:hypothetical protein
VGGRERERERESDRGKEGRKELARNQLLPIHALALGINNRIIARARTSQRGAQPLLPAAKGEGQVTHAAG